MGAFDDIEADRRIVRELYAALPHCDRCLAAGEQGDEAIATHVAKIGSPTPGEQLCETHAEEVRTTPNEVGQVPAPYAVAAKPQRAELLAARAMLARWSRPKKSPVRCDECGGILVHVPARPAGIVDMACGPEHWITWADGKRGVVTDGGFEFADPDETSEDPTT